MYILSFLIYIPPFPRHFSPSSLYSLKYPSREVSPLNPCPYVNHELPSRRLREGTWQDSPQEGRVGWDARGDENELKLFWKAASSKLVRMFLALWTDRVKVIQNDNVTAQNLSSLAKIDPRRRREVPERRKKRHIRRAGQKGHGIPRIMARGNIAKILSKTRKRWEENI